MEMLDGGPDPAAKWPCTPTMRTTSIGGSASQTLDRKLMERPLVATQAWLLASGARSPPPSPRPKCASAARGSGKDLRLFVENVTSRPLEPGRQATGEAVVEHAHSFRREVRTVRPGRRRVETSAEPLLTIASIELVSVSAPASLVGASGQRHVDGG